MARPLLGQRKPTVVGPLEALMEAARAHGQEDDPEHEVGDLQQLLMAAWRIMDTRQRRALFLEFLDLIEDWGEPE